MLFPVLPSLCTPFLFFFPPLFILVDGQLPQFFDRDPPRLLSSHLMAGLNGELTAPLIDSEVAIDVNGLLERGTDAAPDENPYAFLGAPPLELPPMSPIDPFRNQIPSISGMYEWCKTVLCLPIAAARLVLFGIAIAVGYVATLVALYGWKDKQSPMPRWRCRAMWLTRLCARLILFSFG